MKSLRFLERGKSRKAMEVRKVRRKSSYSMGTVKCMGVRRTGRIHSWGSISGHIDDQCGKLIRCIRNIKNRRGRLRDQRGVLRHRSGRLLRKTLRERINRGNRGNKNIVTPHFPRVPLTTVHRRKTCVSHIMRPIHE